MGRIAHRGWHFPSPAILHGKASGGGGGGTAASAFITRAQGVGTYDSTHQTAITTFINGLITDGLLNSDGTSSYLDVLYLFAAPLAGQALLNIVANGSFDGTNNGVAFTPDYGFTNVDGNNTNYVNSNFRPAANTTSHEASGTGSPNGGHIGIWLDSITSSTAAGGNDCGGLYTSNAFLGMNINYNNSGSFFSVNDGQGEITPSSSNKGLWLANRTDSVSVDVYNNATNVGTYGYTAGSLSDIDIFITTCNYSSTPGALTPTSASARPAMAFSIGGTLTSTQVGNLHSRMDTYLTSIAGISY